MDEDQKTPQPLLPSDLSRPYFVPPPRPTPHSIDIRKLSSPLVLTISLLGAAVSGTLVWAKVAGHQDDKVVHLEETLSLKRGGAAYQQDVRELREELRTGMINADRRWRRTLRGAQFNCRRVAGDGIACRIELPEAEE